MGTLKLLVPCYCIKLKKNNGCFLKNFCKNCRVIKKKKCIIFFMKIQNVDNFKYHFKKQLQNV